MTRLILSTSNIMSGGPSIIRKPGNDRSNLELTNSLRRNFIGAQQDYSPPLSDSETPSTKTPTTTTSSSTVNTPSSDSDVISSRPSPAIWTSREGSDLYIPTIDWSLSGLSEEPSAYDVTAKLFFLPGRPVELRAAYARDAAKLVMKELGVPALDLLIVSFPGMSFEGDCEWEADKRNAAQGNDDEEVATWLALEELHKKGIVRKLGLAEFGSEKLARFVSRVNVRPAVDQINVKDCCNVPPPLVKLAREKEITLLTHHDCTDILPSGTLRELLGQGVRGAGILAESKRGIDGMKGDVLPCWVIKYTAVVRDRGVVENKGYFAAAELAE